MGLGYHFLGDFFLCQSEILSSPKELDRGLRKVCKSIGAHVLESHFKSFGKKAGVSGVLILAESHLAIHSWPEENFAAVDIFTCGDLVDPSKAENPLRKLFQSKRVIVGNIARAGVSERSPYLPLESKPKIHSGNWVSEGDGRMALALRHSGRSSEGRSARDRSLETFHNEYFGKVLLLDGEILLTEKDAANYSESHVHPVFFFGKKIKRVLILGGGDGSLLKEVLKHPQVRSVDLVEIDSRVSEICQRHFPKLRSAFRDKRVSFFEEEASNFIKKALSQSYDLILLDFSPGEDFGSRMFSESSLKSLMGLLSSSGSLLLPMGNPELEHRRISATMKKLRKVLGSKGSRNIFPLHLPLPSALLGSWTSLLVSRKALDPKKDFLAADCRRWLRRANCEYYDDEIHRNIFTLPPKWKDVYR